MFVILTAFSLFHLAAAMASLGLAVRLLTAEEAECWQSRRALWVARLLCWIYPLVAALGVGFSWRMFEQAAPEAVAMIIAPFAWLVVMGLIFAIVDFAEDGVIGNARVNK